MSFFKRLVRSVDAGLKVGLEQATQAAAETNSVGQFVQNVVLSPPPISSDTWVMPRFQNRDICDWGDEINRLKRAGRLEEALQIAVGCMDAMAEVAVQNPANAMEHYVIQVAVIQRKLKAYADEIHTIERWLELGIKPPREDFRIELLKRLAKAQEIQAKAEGRDYTHFREEWKRLVGLEKSLKARTEKVKATSTGQSKRNPNRARPKSSHSHRLIPSRQQLMVPDFVAVDFETANRSGGISACQVAFVKVEGGAITDRLVSYLKPPEGYDHFEFTHLHGIGPRKVRSAPTWEQIAYQVSSFVGDKPVYAHNAQFDADVWRHLDVFYGTNTMPEHFFCSYRTARRIIPDLKNYKLPTVLKACAPHYRLNHHRAESDAEACALIVCALQRMG